MWQSSQIVHPINDEQIAACLYGCEVLSSKYMKQAYTDAETYYREMSRTLLADNLTEKIQTNIQLSTFISDVIDRVASMNLHWLAYETIKMILERELHFALPEGSNSVVNVSSPDHSKLKVSVHVSNRHRYPALVLSCTVIEEM